MWELISANKRKSLFLFFAMGVVLLTLGYIIGEVYIPDGGGIAGLFLASIVWVILSLISYFAGDSIMLSVSKAKEVTPDVHPQLYNVVEEMKIASGLPKMPKVYIINASAPNAFATGRNPEKSAVAVTAGLLAALNRDELQGVIAHELAHIKNRDVLFMTFAGIMLGSIVLISDIFIYGMWFSGGSSSRYRSKSSEGGGQAQLIILILAIALAILGLASALEKISNNKYELPGANRVTAGMYIINPLKKKGMKISNLSSTHPPISERIKILRNIAHGAGFLNYQQAFMSVTGKNSKIIPNSGLSEKEQVNFRGKDVESAKKVDSKTQKRNLGDLMMKMNKFAFIACVCGLKLKIPPDYKNKQVKCPKCGSLHEVPLAELAAISAAAMSDEFKK
jgi:heat shock protein HtpX